MKRISLLDLELTLKERVLILEVLILKVGGRGGRIENKSGKL